jgi:hypothetical protein
MISGTLAVWWSAHRSAKLAPMFAASAADLLSTALALVVIAGLFWFAVRIEPHWSAKDGKAFTCRIQPMRASGATEGRWREARGIVSGNDVKLIVKGFGRSVTPYEAHRVLSQAEHPPKRRAVFVLSGDPMYLLRVPENSRAVPVLQALISEA